MAETSITCVASDAEEQRQILFKQLDQQRTLISSSSGSPADKRDRFLKDTENVHRALQTLLLRLDALRSGSIIGATPLSTDSELISRLQQELLQVRMEKEDLRLTLSSEIKILQERVTMPTTQFQQQLVDMQLRLREVIIKFQRAESFRRALIYQKKYLILLLGGFQESEEVTLAMIANMGVTPLFAQRPRADRVRARFRAAVLCAMAATRLRILMRRWQSRLQPHQ